ncbi:MAG: hypothetical protein ACRERX_22510 [Pseudomonas sp.]
MANGSFHAAQFLSATELLTVQTPVFNTRYAPLVRMDLAGRTLSNWGALASDGILTRIAVNESSVVVSDGEDLSTYRFSRDGRSRTLLDVTLPFLHETVKTGNHSQRAGQLVDISLVADTLWLVFYRHRPFSLGTPARRSEGIAQVIPVSEWLTRRTPYLVAVNARTGQRFANVVEEKRIVLGFTDRKHLLVQEEAADGHTVFSIWSINLSRPTQPQRR